MAVIEPTDKLWPFYRITAEIQRAYQALFRRDNQGAEGVLMDLAKFCHAFSATETEREIGRRDVWLHIMRRLMLRDTELTALLARLGAEERRALFDPKTPVYHSSPQQ